MGFGGGGGIVDDFEGGECGICEGRSFSSGILEFENV